MGSACSTPKEVTVPPREEATSPTSSITSSAVRAQTAGPPVATSMQTDNNDSNRNPAAPAPAPKPPPEKSVDEGARAQSKNDTTSAATEATDTDRPAAASGTSSAEPTAAAKARTLRDEVTEAIATVEKLVAEATAAGAEATACSEHGSSAAAEAYTAVTVADAEAACSRANVAADKANAAAAVAAKAKREVSALATKCEQIGEQGRDAIDEVFAALENPVDDDPMIEEMDVIREALADATDTIEEAQTEIETLADNASDAADEARTSANTAMENVESVRETVIRREAEAEEAAAEAAREKAEQEEEAAAEAAEAEAEAAQAARVAEFDIEKEKKNNPMFAASLASSPELAEMCKNDKSYALMLADGMKQVAEAETTFDPELVDKWEKLADESQSGNEDEWARPLDKADASVLNVVYLDPSKSVADYQRVCEKNELLHCIGDGVAPGDLHGNDIAALSWRWDIDKPETLEEAIDVISPKLSRFFERAKKQGFQWVWVDWACVPQYLNKDEIIGHVRASRLVYENCHVIIVDVEEVLPKVAMPTSVYMSRLWTNAEMSACLGNKNVTLGSFVQVEAVNHDTIAFVCSSIRFDTPEEYARAFELGPNDFKEQKHINFVTTAATYGWMPVDEQYPGLPMFLSGFLEAKLTDKTHETSPPPYGHDEQEATIKAFIAAGCKSVELDALYAECKASGCKMKSDFSFSKHYTALLHLGYIAFDATMKQRPWNPKCYQMVLRCLKELPYDTEESNLSFTMPGDDAIVKQMIVAENRLLPNPCQIRGVALLRAPTNHELHFKIPGPKDLTCHDLVRERWQLAPTHCQKISISISLMAGGVMSYAMESQSGPTRIVINSGYTMEDRSNIVVFASVANELSEYTETGTLELWLGVYFASVAASGVETGVNTKKAEVRGLGKGVTTDIVRTIDGLMAAEVSADAITDESNGSDLAALKGKLLDILGRGGLVVGDTWVELRDEERPNT